jgi:flagellar basal body rod protein FlgG
VSVAPQTAKSPRTKSFSVAVVDVDDRDRLVKQGDNAFGWTGETRGATGTIRAETLEGSGVDPIITLNDLVSTSRAVTANTKLMQYHDQMSEQVIGALGKVA